MRNNNYTYKAEISTKCSSALNTDYIQYGSNNITNNERWDDECRKLYITADVNVS